MNAPAPMAEAAPVGERHATVHADPGLYCAHPHMVRAGDGTLLLVFNAAPRREVVLHPPLDPAFRNLLVRSTDDGRTWSEPEPVPGADTAGLECAGLTALSDGSVLLNQWQFGWAPPGAFDPADPTFYRPEELAAGWAASREFSGLHDAPAPTDLFALARCGGRTLMSRAASGSAPFRHAAELDVAPFCGGYGMRGGVELADGSVLLPLSDVPRYRTVFAVRLDRAGHQLGEPLLVAEHPGSEFEEPAPLRLADDTILLILRDNGTRMLSAVRSLDEGLTWSDPRRLPIADYPASVVRLPDGPIALVAGRRRPPFGIALYLGSPSGRRWRGPYPIRDDLPDIDLGYPAAVLTTGGNLLVVYYGREPGGHTTIQQSVVAAETLERLAREHG